MVENLDQLDKIAEQTPDPLTKLLIYLLGILGAAILGMWYYSTRQNDKQAKEIKELHKDCEDRLEKHNEKLERHGEKLEEIIKDTSEIAAKATVAIQEVIAIKTRR